MEKRKMKERRRAAGIVAGTGEEGRSKKEVKALYKVGLCGPQLKFEVLAKHCSLALDRKTHRAKVA